MYNEKLITSYLQAHYVACRLISQNPLCQRLALNFSFCILHFDYLLNNNLIKLSQFENVLLRTLQSNRLPLYKFLLRYLIFSADRRNVKLRFDVYISALQYLNL